MRMYVSEVSKSIFVTEVRTGSTSLGLLAQLGILKKFDDSPGPRIALEPGGMVSLCDRIKTDYHDYTVYVCIRDPQIRRQSALLMITGQHREGATFSENMSFLRGMVSETVKQKTHHQKYGFINHTLNDNHVDWGTSSYYPVFVINGIMPKLLHVNNKNLFQIPEFIYPYRLLEDRDYHTVLSEIIRKYHSDNREALELWKDKDASVNAGAINNYHNGLWNVNPLVVHRSATYQYYYNMFSTMDHTERWLSVSNSLYHGGLGNPRSATLPFQTWIDMEDKMYHWALQIDRRKEDRDLAVTTCQWLLDQTLKTYAEYYKFHEIAEAYDNHQFKCYPGSTFLRLFSMDYLESFLTHT